MTKIRRFVIEYGRSHPFTEVSLVYKKGQFYHLARFWPSEESNDQFWEKQPIEISLEKLNTFVQFVKEYCSDWEKSYEELVLDGTIWKVHMHIDDVKLKTSGTIHFPENFDAFMEQMAVLTEGARG